MPRVVTADLGISRASIKVNSVEIDKKHVGTEPCVAYGTPEPGLAAASPKKGGGYLVCKRIFDILFSMCVCMVAAIPVAIACVVIAIESPGSPIFCQERIGQGGRPIRIFKLRSMVADAHSNPQKYMTPEQFDV